MNALLTGTLPENDVDEIGYHRLLRPTVVSCPFFILPATKRWPHSPLGFSLIELVITVAVLSVLTLGVIPVAHTSIRRQREQRLREALREMRAAIDEFRRDTVGMQCVGVNGVGVNAQAPGRAPDPRSGVVIADCTIFGVDNPDRYPPDLETLVNGVSIVPRASLAAAASGAPQGDGADNPLLSTRKKVYLHEIPIDPVTGERGWCIRSSYDPPGEGCSSAPANVFDVTSKAGGTALNGEKYSMW